MIGRCLFEAPKEVSTCRSKGPRGELIERTYDYVIASRSLKGKITKIEVVKDFESRPHKAVPFQVDREKGVPEWKEQKMPEALPGCSGGMLPGSSTAEEGREEEDEDEEANEEGGDERSCCGHNEGRHQIDTTKIS